MKNSEKKQLVHDFSKALANVPVMILVSHQEMDVTSERQFRAALRSSDAVYKVMKNKLSAFLVERLGYQAPSDLFKGQTAWVYGSEPVKIARSISAFAKSTKKITLLGGFWEGHFVETKRVESLSVLTESKNIYTLLLWMLKSRASSLVRVMAAYVEKQNG